MAFRRSPVRSRSGPPFFTKNFCSSTKVAICGCGCAWVAPGCAGRSSRPSTAVRFAPGIKWPYVSTVIWIDGVPELLLHVDDRLALAQQQ